MSAFERQQFVSLVRDLELTTSDIEASRILEELTNLCLLEEGTLNRRYEKRVFGIFVPIIVKHFHITNQDLILNILKCQYKIGGSSLVVQFLLGFFTQLTRSVRRRFNENYSDEHFIELFLICSRITTFGGLTLTAMLAVSYCEQGSFIAYMALRANPITIRKLLQYGAWIDGKDNHSAQALVALSIVCIIKRGLELKLWTSNLAILDEEAADVTSMFNMFALILSTVAVQQNILSELSDRTIDDYYVPPVEILTEFLDHMIPDIKLFLLQPPTLKHLCRYSIRKQCRNFPITVEDSILPITLQDYLNMRN